VSKSNSSWASALQEFIYSSGLIQFILVVGLVLKIFLFVLSLHFHSLSIPAAECLTRIFLSEFFGEEDLEQAICVLIINRINPLTILQLIILGILKSVKQLG